MMKRKVNMPPAATTTTAIMLLFLSLSGVSSFTLKNHRLYQIKSLRRNSFYKPLYSSSFSPPSDGDFDEVEPDFKISHNLPIDDIYDLITSIGEENGRLSDEELSATLGDWDERVAPLNTVHLIGRIAATPEPRRFDDGNMVVNVSLAAKRKYHNLERELSDIKFGEEGTDWFGLEIWGKTAEFVSKYVDKGSRVGVVGTLQIDEWTDKATGEPRNRPKIIVRELDVLESRAEAELRRSNSRGPSFYTESDTVSDNDDGYSPNAAGSGGFF